MRAHPFGSPVLRVPPSDPDMSTESPSPSPASPPEPAFPTAPWFHVPRRAFLLAAGAAFLAGCAGGSGGSAGRTARLPGGELARGLDRDPPLDLPDPGPCPTPAGQTLAKPDVAVPGGVIRRSQWAKGAPIGSQLNPMLPPRYVTVHHEGWDAFTDSGYAETAARLEQVRVGHLNAKGGGYADIGYHFVIDRAGRVWEGRSLQYQGAHVKRLNEHNIGVMCLGNFEEQTPSPQQLAALDRHLRSLMAKYRISANNVKTHREWKGAATLCPGRNLQAHVARARPNGFC